MTKNGSDQRKAFLRERGLGVDVAATPLLLRAYYTVRRGMFDNFRQREICLLMKELDMCKNDNKECAIVCVDNPEESAWGIIGQGINQYNKQQAGDDKPQRICFVVQTPEGTIMGGVIGVMYWDWLYVDLMWLPEELRGRGYGHQLLMLLEDEARKRGAMHVYLDTFSFQAPEFYKKHGYQVFGKLTDFPAGHERYFLTKQL